MNKQNKQSIRIAHYKHFDKALHLLSPSLQNQIKDFVKSPSKIATHGFYPLIAFDKSQRHISIKNKVAYYKNLLQNPNTLTKKEQKDCKDKLEKLQKDKLIKTRPIRYSSHIDSCIYVYYADLLNRKYEIKLQYLDLDKEVLAYRKFDQKTNNCTMANEVFIEIRARKHKCFALAFDISNFFDSIEHKRLYKSWCEILGLESLPSDHLNIFKSLTKYCFAMREELLTYIDNCNLESYVEYYKAKRISKKYFANARDFRDFRKWYKEKYKDTNHANFHKNPHINTDNPHGIPQGLSISGVLSNIYLLSFDIAMKSLAIQNRAIYRRYCDDIIFVCPSNKQIKSKIIKAVSIELAKCGESLKIYPINAWDKYSKSQCYDFRDKDKIKHNPLQYLGFYYNGESVRIRESTLSRYMRKSARGVIATKLNAIRKLKDMQKNNIPLQEKHKKLYRRKLYERYTHLGKQNFISYAKGAFATFNDTTIKHQISNHFKRFKKLIDEADKDIKQFLIEQNLA